MSWPWPGTAVFLAASLYSGKLDLGGSQLAKARWLAEQALAYAPRENDHPSMSERPWIRLILLVGLGSWQENKVIHEAMAGAYAGLPKWVSWPRGNLPPAGGIGRMPFIRTGPHEASSGSNRREKAR